jgi:hypothetical protein
MADLLRLGGNQVGDSFKAVRTLLTERNLETLALERRKTARETTNRTSEVLLSPVA